MNRLSNVKRKESSNIYPFLCYIEYTSIIKLSARRFEISFLKTSRYRRSRISNCLFRVVRDLKCYFIRQMTYSCQWAFDGSVKFERDTFQLESTDWMFVQPRILRMVSTDKKILLELSATIDWFDLYHFLSLFGKKWFKLVFHYF